MSSCNVSRSPVNTNNLGIPSTNTAHPPWRSKTCRPGYSPPGMPLFQTRLPTTVNYSWTISIPIYNMLSQLLPPRRLQSFRCPQHSTTSTQKSLNAFEPQPINQDAFHHQECPDCQLLSGSQRLFLLCHHVNWSHPGACLRCRRGVPTTAASGGTTTFERCPPDFGRAHTHTSHTSWDTVTWARAVVPCLPIGNGPSRHKPTHL